MQELANENTTLMFHAEMIPPITDSVGDDVQISLPPLAPRGPLDAYSTFLASRPSSFETYAIEEIISLAHLAPNLPLHVVHLSAIEAIPILREARARGVKITAETCFHYLSLAAEQVEDGDTRHKCCPPIRTQSNQDGLWEELHKHQQDGVIQTVVSDHSPCTPDLKLLPTSIHGSCAPREGALSPDGTSEAEHIGDFFAAWGGVSSVGLGLPILWTELTRRNPTIASPDSDALNATLLDVVKWCCINTSKQVGLQDKKGKLAVGFDADIAIFDDTEEWVLGEAAMLFRNKCSPYHGRKLRGAVKETILRGETIFRRGNVMAPGNGPEKSGFTVPEPTGQLLLRQ